MNKKLTKGKIIYLVIVAILAIPVLNWAFDEKAKTEERIEQAKIEDKQRIKAIQKFWNMDEESDVTASAGICALECCAENNFTFSRRSYRFNYLVTVKLDSKDQVDAAANEISAIQKATGLKQREIAMKHGGWKLVRREDYRKNPPLPFDGCLKLKCGGSVTVSR